jgi:uncharacterized protein YutE (UPF0331/DUF86 family)
MPIELDDVCFQKAGNIEKCIRRILAEYNSDPSLQNLTHLDALVLNIERACQATIDLASHIVSKNHFGIPSTSSESFELLNDNGIISNAIRDKMISMTGFRNIAIHEYEKLNTSIVESIATKDYNSLIQFCAELGMKIVV